MIKSYQEKIQFNIYGKDSLDRESSIKEIEECEKMLGLLLPTSLKELYEVFGKEKKILNACNFFSR